MTKRIAVITGAGTGVGKAAALALSEAGWTVVLTGRRRELLDEAAAACAGETLVVPADVADAAAVDALFATVEKAFGRVDLLFNNAGMGTRAVPMDELSVEEWTQAVAVNLTGAFLCTRAAFGLMRRQTPHGGRIINNGSVSATTPRPFSAPYTATKHAISGLTKSTALDGRQWDIACGQIDIGNAATEMTARMVGGVLQADLTTKPEPRMDVSHVGSAIVHMANLPLETNVLFMTIKATKMPFEGRG